MRPFLMVCLLLAVGCHRSGQYRQEEGFASDVAVSYYRDPETGISAVHALDAMVQPKKKIAVLNFWNDTPVEVEGIGTLVGEILRKELERTQRVLISREDESLTTRSFVEGKQVKVGELVRKGRKLGLNGILLGRISRMVFRQMGEEVGVFRQKQSFAAVELEMKLFEVASGREIFSATRSTEVSSRSSKFFGAEESDSPAFRAELIRASAQEAVRALVERVVQAVDKMTWEGQIAKIEGSKIYVNAGHDSGLHVGDILKVFTLGDEIYDPVSGSLLGRAQGHLKGTLEVKSFVGEDTSLNALHTGGGLKVGDFVQLY